VLVTLEGNWSRRVTSPCFPLAVLRAGKPSQAIVTHLRRGNRETWALSPFLFWRVSLAALTSREPG
jgi:hypothetical protein